jgi:hypothetical protein
MVISSPSPVRGRVSKCPVRPPYPPIRRCARTRPCAASARTSKQAAGAMADDARRADGHHHSDQHQHALERRRVGVRKVGVGHRQREQPDHHVDDAPGGRGGVAIEPVHLQLAAFDALEHRAGGQHHQPRDGGDQGDEHQAWQCVDDVLRDAGSDLNQIVLQPLAPAARVRDFAGHESQPQVGRDQPHRPDSSAAAAVVLKIAISNRIPSSRRGAVIGILEASILAMMPWYRIQ